VEPSLRVAVGVFSANGAGAARKTTPVPANAGGITTDVLDTPPHVVVTRTKGGYRASD
jgi:hypothetical protein